MSELGRTSRQLWPCRVLIGKLPLDTLPAHAICCRVAPDIHSNNVQCGVVSLHLYQCHELVYHQ